MDQIWFKSYQKGVPHTIDMGRYSSMVDVIETMFEKFSFRPAYHCMGTTLTFNDLKKQSQNFASYLQNDLKLKKGDRVALMMPNILQYPVALFGLLQAGLIAVHVHRSEE